MKQIAFIITITMILFACNEKAKEADSKEVNETEQTQEVRTPGQKNFAVVWSLTSTETKYVTDRLDQITKELTDLWEAGFVENIYFDAEATLEKDIKFPNISFFLKANSKEEAVALLDELTIVKDHVARYILHPVGAKWLGRNDEQIKKNGESRVFVSIWKTENFNESYPPGKTVVAQSDAVLAYFKKGLIENVYFDIEGNIENDLTDFVFFINADNQDEAQKLIDELPFAKEKIASYKLLPVGILWKGVAE